MTPVIVQYSKWWQGHRSHFEYHIVLRHGSYNTITGQEITRCNVVTFNSHSSNTARGSTSVLSSPPASSWGNVLARRVASDMITRHCSPSNLFVAIDHPRAFCPHSISLNCLASLRFPFSSVFILMSSPVAQNESARSV